MWQEFVRLLVQQRYTNLWFIACLFSANCFFYFLCKYIRGFIWKLMIVFLLSLSIYVYWKKNGDSLPWNIDASLFVLPFMLVAKRMHDKKILSDIIIKQKVKYFTIFLFGNVLLGGLNYFIAGKRVDLFFKDVDNIMLTYLAAFCGIIWIVLLSQYRFIHLVNYIGKNSLLIFAWHLVVYNWLAQLYDFFGIFQVPMPLYMIIIRDALSLVLILSVLISLNEFILHSRLKFILGK